MSAFGADAPESRGVLSAVSPSSVTLKVEHGVVSCRVGDNAPSLAGFAAGDKVVVVCKRVGDAWSFLRIRHLPTISLDGEHDMNITCTFSSSSPRLGDYHVQIACSAGVLIGIHRIV